MADTALITGFEPYGGRGLNPSAKLALALDGERIGGFDIVGRSLPVAFAGLGEQIEGILDAVRPRLIVALGLWPGEPMIRLERVGLNLADFEIPDNAGNRPEDAVIAPAGATALAATLPLRAIEQALLAAGIPARLSSTAGTFLCNATLYTLLAALERRRWRIPCGFIHVPYLTEQVAEMLTEARAGQLEMHQRADLASMDYAVMERALRLVLAVTAAAARPPRG